MRRTVTNYQKKNAFIENRKEQSSLNFSFKILRITAILTLTCIISLNAFAYSQEKLTLKLKDASIKELFDTLQNNSNFHFIYNNEDLENAPLISIDEKDATFEQIIKRNLTNYPLEFTLSEDVIIVSRKSNDQIRDIEVSGKVVDSSGSPLPGVAVYLENDNSVGTTTDLNGRYSLEAPEESVLIFQMVGFEVQKIPLDHKEKINVILLPSSSKLDEAVVVAFGKQKKEEVVGSVTTINPSELKVPSSNLTTALAGRLAGVVAFQRTGEPGQDDADFFIRGVTTFGFKRDPLILVDGIELTTRDLARMQVDDIENFSILKDAAATALYGARGANGVILIETKEGKEGKAKVDVRIENSVSMPTKNIDLADPITYMRLNNEAVLTRNPLGVRPYSREKIENTLSGTDPVVFPSNDWRKILFKDYTMNQRANLNVSGGGKVARYYIAGTFNKDNGILKVDKRNNFNNNIDLKTYELRANVNVNLTKTTEIGVKLYGTFDDYTGPILGGSEFYHRAVRSDPVSFLPFYPKDSMHQNVNHILFGSAANGGLENPYADMVRGFKEYNQSLMLAQFNFNQDLSFVTKGLKLKALFNTTRFSYFDVTRAYKPFFYEIGFYDKIDGSYTLNLVNEEQGTEFLDYEEGPKQVRSTTYVQSILNYDRTFGERHTVGGMLVFLLQNRLEGNAGSLETSLPHRNLGISGRFTYSFDKRYFGEFDFGYNGSERFFKSHRFGFFPSVGFGWQVSNENFWEGISNTVNNLKFRATYGLIGNDAVGSASDRFFFISDVDMDDSNRGASFGIDFDNSKNGIRVKRYPNPGISWEKSYKLNLGMDLSLFNNVDVAVDYWKEHRTNILMTRASIPTSMGLTAIPQANLGETKGQGIEFSIDYSKFFNSGFWIQGRANFTYALSKYYKYEEAVPDSEPWLSRIGYPIGQQWGYIAERLFVDEKEVANSPNQGFGEQPLGGDIKYRDVNRDGKISTLDQVPIGYPLTPEIVYGFGLSLGYKAFDFSFFFQGLAKESFWIDLENTSPFATSEAPNGLQLKNQLIQAYADDHWSEGNRNPYALWPRLSTNVNENNAQMSTWFMRNGAFLRLKNAEIGYTLPSEWAKKVYLERARIYINGINLFNITPFKLWDVEMAGRGLDYPVQRVLNVGLKVSF